MPGRAETDRRGRLPVAIQLQDAGVARLVVCPAYADVNRAICPDRDREHTPDLLRAKPLALEHAVAIEDLNPRVLAVGDEHVAALPERQPVRVAELARPGAFLAPL